MSSPLHLRWCHLQPHTFILCCSLSAPASCAHNRRQVSPRTHWGRRARARSAAHIKMADVAKKRDEAIKAKEDARKYEVSSESVDVGCTVHVSSRTNVVRSCSGLRTRKSRLKRQRSRRHGCERLRSHSRLNPIPPPSSVDSIFFRIAGAKTGRGRGYCGRGEEEKRRDQREARSQRCRKGVGKRRREGQMSVRRTKQPTQHAAVLGSLPNGTRACFLRN